MMDRPWDFIDLARLVFLTSRFAGIIGSRAKTKKKLAICLHDRFLHENDNPPFSTRVGYSKSSLIRMTVRN
jgi:hypothetical protein